MLNYQTHSAPAKLEDDPFPHQDADALRHLRDSIAQGNHWFTALLEAIARWRSPEEEYQGRRYRYLVGGEAFDWLLLAERLCSTLDGLAPEDEREALLFFGRFPVDIGPWEFQRLIGRTKYRAYLNYWYGVMVEEALLLTVEERIAKERATIGFTATARDYNMSYSLVYGASQQELLERYYKERNLPPTDRVSLSELREFVYWCFKYRLEHCDPAKVASDTRRGIDRLTRLRLSRGLRPDVM